MAWWPAEAADAVRLSLAVVAAIWLSMRFELSEPHWAGWTVLSVTLATRASSLRKSLWRAMSTVVGVAVAIALVANFGQQTLAFDVAIALWIGLLTAASTIESGQRSYGFALMGFTVPIVAFANVDQPTAVFATGVDRCSTILLGIFCAYAANVPVAPGVPKVAGELAARLEAAADACAAWFAVAAQQKRDPGPMPSGQVSALGEAIVDSFTEQPSLRFGGQAILEAPSRLRHALAAGLLRARLPQRTGARSTTLLGDEHAQADRQIARVRVAARLLRGGRGIGGRAPMRAHLLLWNDLDWDGRTALNNALRAMATVSIVNAFWYVSEWPSGSTAATWASLLSVLLASRPDPVAAARAFTVSVPLAVIVGLVVRYGVLTMSGDFGLLAAVLMPVAMLAVIGRSDPRAVYGIGYGFLVLGVIDPRNAMTYDLTSSLNQALAELLGMGFAVVAFAALPPPASAATRRRRAQRRLLRSVHAAAADPKMLLPQRNRWLTRGFGRLALIAEGPDPHYAGHTLLLTGMLLLALRKADDALGRRVGHAVWSDIAEGGGQPGTAPALRALARSARDPLQRERVAALATLLDDLDVRGWPGMPPAAPAPRAA